MKQTVRVQEAVVTFDRPTFERVLEVYKKRVAGKEPAMRDREHFSLTVDGEETDSLIVGVFFDENGIATEAVVSASGDDEVHELQRLAVLTRTGITDPWVAKQEVRVVTLRNRIVIGSYAQEEPEQPDGR